MGVIFFYTSPPRGLPGKRSQGARWQGDTGQGINTRAHLPTCHPAPSPLCGAYMRSTGSMPSSRNPTSKIAVVREQSIRRRAFTAGSSTMTLSAA